MEYFEYSYNNYSKWEDQTYQSYFPLAKNSHCEEERKQYLKQAEQVLMDEMPVIPIYNHSHLYISNEKAVHLEAPEFDYSDFKWIYFRD